MTKDFGMRFWGENPFNKETRKEFQGKWSNMTDSEKLEFMNKKMENMGHDRFSVEAINAHCEKWMKLSAEEKQAHVDELKQAFEEQTVQKGCFEDDRFELYNLYSC